MARTSRLHRSHYRVPDGVATMSIDILGEENRTLSGRWLRGGFSVAGGSGSPLAAYDRAKCIKILMDRDGMTEDAAEEFFEFNVIGAWLGEGTPVFIDVAMALREPSTCEAP